MTDAQKTKEQLLAELEALRKQLAELQSGAPAQNSSGQSGPLGAALKASEGKWRSIAETSPDHIMTLDLDGTITYINRTVWDLNKDDVIGTSVYRYVGEEFHPAMQACFEQVAANAEPGAYDVDYRDAEGNLLSFESRVGPVIGDGRVIGFTVRCTDVTARRREERRLRRAQVVLEQRVESQETELQQTEVALEESELKLRHLLENVPDFVIVVDRRGQIRFTNRSVVGVPQERMLGSSGFQHIASEDQARCRQALERALADREVQTLEARTIYGRCWDCCLVPLLGSGDDPVVMIICTDVTQGKAVASLLETQRHLVTELNGIWSMDEALELCCETAMRITGLDHGGILVADQAKNFHLRFVRGGPEGMGDNIQVQKADSPLAQRILRGKPQYYHASEATSENRSILMQAGFQGIGVIPILHKTEPIACLVFASYTLPQIPPHSRAALEVIAASVGGALARITATQMLAADQALLRKMIDLQERERKLVAHDIHDGFVQDVVSAKMQLEGIRANLPNPTDAVTAQLDAAGDLLDTAVREGRRMIGELRPLIIDEKGIVDAVEYLLGETRRRSGLETVLEHAVEFERLDPVLEGVVFRIVQEAVTNVERHSQADTVSVWLHQRANRLTVEIEDQGVGFSEDQVPPNRFGLRGIRERARLFDGQASIVSSPGQGTKVTVELPVIEAAAK